MRISVLVLLLGLSVHSHLLRMGLCPDFSAFANFDIEKYKGKWYRTHSFFSWTGFLGQCWVHRYEDDFDIPGKYILKLQYRIAEIPLSMEMDIYQQHPSDPGTLTSQKFGIPFTAEEYQVLSTDYDNWAVEWRCEHRGLFQYREALWILSRKPNPTAEEMYPALDAVEALGLKASSLRRDSQHCFFERRYSYHEPVRRTSEFS